MKLGSSSGVDAVGLVARIYQSIAARPALSSKREPSHVPANVGS